jgi:hypothetical protein
VDLVPGNAGDGSKTAATNRQALRNLQGIDGAGSSGAMGN